MRDPISSPETVKKKKPQTMCNWPGCYDPYSDGEFEGFVDAGDPGYGLYDGHDLIGPDEPTVSQSQSIWKPL